MEHFEHPDEAFPEREPLSPWLRTVGLLALMGFTLALGFLLGLGFWKLLN